MSTAQQASYVAAAANYSAAAARAYGAAASQPAAGYATIAGYAFFLLLIFGTYFSSMQVSAGLKLKLPFLSLFTVMVESIQIRT